MKKTTTDINDYKTIPLEIEDLFSIEEAEGSSSHWDSVLIHLRKAREHLRIALLKEVLGE